MSGLAEFLQARIAEDEEVARSCGVNPNTDRPVRWSYTHANPESLRPFPDEDLPDGVIVRSHQLRDPVQVGDWVTATYWEEDGEHIARHDPARVLAECEAKREMVGLLRADCGDPKNAIRREWASEILKAIAAVYADHPDYRQEWRP